jgi:hypothetical protein
MSMLPSTAFATAAVTAASHAAGHSTSGRGQKQRAKSPPHAASAAANCSVDDSA